jgi:hypothetical protein
VALFIRLIIHLFRLRLSAKSASQPAVFFSHKKPAISTFNQSDQPKRTDQCFSVGFSAQPNRARIPLLDFFLTA